MMYAEFRGDRSIWILQPFSFSGFVWLRPLELLSLRNLIKIVLKWLQRGIETKVTPRRVEVSRIYSISFLYFKLSQIPM